LTALERTQLHAGLRSSSTFTVRRCQIVLASADGQTAPAIARTLRCTAVAVRTAIHAFHREGVACLRQKSSRPHSARPLLDATFAEPLRALLHHSPRTLGKPRSTWTLALVAAVCSERGWTPRVLSIDTIRLAIQRLGVSWRRAKHWITSPDPAYARKKHARDRLIRLAHTHPEWVLGYEDETWWSRLAQPALHVWTANEPLRLVELARDRTDPEPKALACYGILRADTGDMLLRFVQGRPVSQVTEDFLAWVCQRLAAEGKKALLLIWDNASWHVSQRVRLWIQAHNRRVKQEGGVRIVVCGLPVKAPWLNAIEPKWAHGKKAIVEPDHVLAGDEVERRACAYYHCDQEEHLKQVVVTTARNSKRKKVA